MARPKRFLSVYIPLCRNFQHVMLSHDEDGFSDTLVCDISTACQLHPAEQVSL